ncbi:MAG: calcineurin-like phosphoesterase C-terminal domain-containing protein [Odoribacter sp.]|nr:calcineurin-like phosphoesterase C-terminal domain-containing protein [Odoribacter sp.]
MKNFIRKFIYILLIICSLSYVVNGREISGVVKSANKYLKGVVVTDGVNFSVTDKKGKYKLEVDDKALFVYIFTPSGYVAPYQSGNPEFYISLEQQLPTYDFDLIPVKGMDRNYTLIAVGDPQPRTDENMEVYQKEMIPDFKNFIGQVKEENKPAIGIALGDIVWDNFDLFPLYKAAVASLGIPFYAVIGNHDHDLNCTDEYESEAVYRKYFGPAYYGFNMGKTSYIVLDNIVYHGQKKYDEILNERQLEWLKEYKKYIPKGNRICIAMHASLMRYWEEGENRYLTGGTELMDLFKGYEVHFMTGHTHLNSNLEVAPGMIEHNVGQINGNLWADRLNRDGSPKGYQVFWEHNNDFNWTYKALGKELDYQMRVYPKNTFEDKPNDVTAIVWNWDNKWKVEWYEDGQYKGEMVQFQGHDPEYLMNLKEQQTAEKN